MVSRTTEDAMCIASEYVCGKSTVVICHIRISALRRFHLQLFDRLIGCFWYSFSRNVVSDINY